MCPVHTLRQRKVGKRKATPLAVSLRFPAGSLRCSVVGRCCGTRCVHFVHCAQTAAASQSTKHGHALLPMPAPRPALLGTARGEFNSNTGHRCARPRQQPTPRPSAAMARVGFPPPGGCACGAALAGWRVQRSMHALRGLARGGCLSEESAANKASSTAHPASAATQVGPEAKRRGRRRGGALCSHNFTARSERTPLRDLLPPFLVRTRKGGALPGAHPGQPMHAEPAAAKAAGTEPTPAAPHPHHLPKGAREQDRSTARWGATQTPGRPSPPPSHQRGEGARQGRGRKAGEVA